MGMKVAVCSLVVTLFSGCGTNFSSLYEAWDERNEPLRVSRNFVATFAALPLQGEVSESQRPWSDTYWPSRRAGISSRWLGFTNDYFSYQLHTESEIRAMNREQLTRLSPAEKYDIFMGRFDYPTVAKERSRTSPDDEGWEGLCHGWAASSLLYSEPMPRDVISASGIVVPFGAADIKALLTYYEGEVRKNAGSRHVGVRCNADLDSNPEYSDRPECRDTNAGAFHVVLANQLGRIGTGFVLDVTRDRQVWNQPLIRYETRVLGEAGPSEGAAEGTVRELEIETDVTWAVENSPTWDPVIGTPYQVEQMKSYRYRLELNAIGDIVGGEWLQEDRPDFLWVPKKSEFENYWQGISEIYTSVR